MVRSFGTTSVFYVVKDFPLLVLLHTPMPIGKVSDTVHVIRVVMRRMCRKTECTWLRSHYYSVTSGFS